MQSYERHCSPKLQFIAHTRFPTTKERIGSVNVFISYSLRDYEWVHKLYRLLKPLVKSGDLMLVSDVNILPGEDWDKRVKEFIESADVVVALVSPSYLASQFISAVELPLLLEAARQNRTQLVPLLIRPTQLEGEIQNWQFLNPPSQELSSLPKGEQEFYLQKVYHLVRGLASKTGKRRDEEAITDNLYEQAIRAALKKTGNVSIDTIGDGNIFSLAASQLLYSEEDDQS